MHPPQERAVERDPDHEHVQEGGDEPGQQDDEVVGLVPAHVPEGVPVASLYLACLRMAQHLEQGVFVGVQSSLGQVAARFGHEVVEIDGGWGLACPGLRGHGGDRMIGREDRSLTIQFDAEGDQRLPDLAELHFQGVDSFRDVPLDAEVVVELGFSSS